MERPTRGAAIILLWTASFFAGWQTEAQNTSATQISRLARDIDRAEGIRAIKALQIAYGQYAQAGMWTDMASLFSSRGEAIYGDDDVKGRSAIAQYYLTNFGAGHEGIAASGLDVRLQFTPVIHLSADGKTARGRWHEFAMLGVSSGDARWAGGIMENEYVKQDGVWRIERLHYYPQLAGTYAAGWHNITKDLKVVPYHYAATDAGVPIPKPPNDADLPRLTGTLEINLRALDRRIAVLNDEDKIRNLQNIYGYYIDRKMWDDVTDLFTEDAVLDLAGQGIYDGPAGIRRALEIAGPAGLALGELNDHLQLDVSVSIAPNGAEARARGFEFGMLGQNHSKGYLTFSIFENRYRKTNGIWKICEMRIFPVMKTDYTLGWGKSRIVDGPAPSPHGPDRGTPVEDQPGSVPAFFLANPATGKKISYPPGTKVSATEDIISRAAPPVAKPFFRLAEARTRLAQSIGYDALENVSSAYGNYVDDFQWAALADLFTPGGARKVPSVGSYIGRDRIARSDAVMYGPPRSPREFIPMHMRTQPVIDISEDALTARIRTRLFQLGSSANGPGSFSTGGMYEDKAAFQNGIWELSDSQIDHIWRSPGYKQGWIDVPYNFGMSPPAKILGILPPDVPIKGSTFAPFPAVGRLWFHYRNPVSGRIPEDYWPD